MRKFFAIILVCVFVLSTFSFTNIFATEQNLISENNATFESGATDWKAYSGGKVEIVDNPDGESKVLKYSGYPEEKRWAAFTLDIKPYIQAAFEAETTLYLAMDVYTTGESKNLQLLVRTEKPEDFSLCNENGLNYAALHSEDIKIPFESNTWKRFEIEFTVSDEDIQSNAKYWNLCFNGLPLTKGDIYIDNVYLGAEPDPILASTPQVTNAPIPSKNAISRSNETLVGAIRWDAFTESTKGGKDVASQVANVLSPAKYHNQAPFFASIEADGTVSFPEYTLDIWEQEAQFAINAGLDYFAYLWYDSSDPMSQARKLHLQSDIKDDIKMVAILENIRSDKTMAELFSAMQDSCYIKLAGQPVLFIYDLTNWNASKILKVRQGAANAGIDKALYVVGMDSNANKLQENLALGLDAISWYGSSPKIAAEPFSTLAKNCEDDTAAMLKKAKELNCSVIPCFTLGRDCRGRIETPVTWIGGDPNAENDKDKPYMNLYSLQPTTEELANHVTNMYNCVKDNPQVTAPNMLLSYAWNEHEEGGWLCPTILCDENGNPIKDENGNYKLNTERLDTLKETLDTLKKPSVSTDTKTPAPTLSPTLTPTMTANTTDAPNGKVKGEINPLFIIIPAIIIVAASVTVCLIILKKKRKED